MKQAERKSLYKNSLNDPHSDFINTFVCMFNGLSIVHISLLAWAKDQLKQNIPGVQQ